MSDAALYWKERAYRAETVLDRIRDHIRGDDPLDVQWIDGLADASLVMWDADQSIFADLTNSPAPTQEQPK